MSIYALSLGYNVQVFPHVQFEGCMTIDEMKALANDIRDEYFKRAQADTTLYEYANNITIYGDNSYCYETNGTGNVVMSWRGQSRGVFDKKDKTYTYTYIIMRSEKDNKTYCGPIQHTEYIYNTEPYVRFCKKTCDNQFTILDDFMKSRENARMIGLFDIQTDGERDTCIADYKEYQGILADNSNTIALNKKKIALFNEIDPTSEDYDFKKRKNDKLVKATKSKVDHSKLLTDTCYNFKDILSRYGVDVSAF